MADNHKNQLEEKTLPSLRDITPIEMKSAILAEAVQKEAPKKRNL